MNSDPARQQERTQLAWRRSTLAFVVVGLAVVRASVSSSAVVTIALAAFGIGLAGWVALTTLRRGRWTTPLASGDGHLRVLRDGTLPFLVAAAAVALCLAVAVAASGLLA